MPHTIYRNASGERLPSVTTVLRPWGESDGLAYAANKLGLAGKSHRTEWGKLARLGTLVHEVCTASLLAGTRPAAARHRALDDAIEQVSGNVPDDLLDRFGNCCAAWAICLKEVKFGACLGAEQNLISEVHQYGGTPDVCITMGQPAILDFKTGGTYPDHLIQIAAYRELWNENVDDKKKRAKCGYLVRLNRDSGGYELKHIPESTMDVAWDIFQSIHHAFRTFKVLKAAM
jgi:hypothetical protein